MRTQLSGRRAERLALTHLRRSGLTLVQKNFRCRSGEIDLIMQDRTPLQDHVLVFIEVRFRSSRSYGGPGGSVTPAKRQRIVRCAARFLQVQRDYAKWPCRFDVVALQGNPDEPDIEWIKGAFAA